MVVYKLFRLKDGKLFPLFINRNKETKIGEWLPAECIPTKGFAIREGWHCCFKPLAPHLKIELASGEKRVWCECTALDTSTYSRPESQGGAWVLAQLLKVNRILSPFQVHEILMDVDSKYWFDNVQYLCLGRKQGYKCKQCPYFQVCYKEDRYND